MDERRFIEVGSDSQKELTEAGLGDGTCSLAIIGAPGMGKSHFLQRRAMKAPGRFSCLTVRNFLNGTVSDMQGKVLLLDGLDECAGQLDKALDKLCRRLNSLGRPRFWLTCRQAGWVGEVFLPILRGCCDEIKVCQMLPLQQQAQEQFVDRMRKRPANMQFLERLRSRLGDQVAGNPLLLKMACRHDAPQGSTGDIYANYVSVLMDEHNPAVAYRRDRAAGPTEPELKVAGRMMLVLLAAGKIGFRKAKAKGAGSDDLLALEDVIAPGQLSTARDILNTSLFAGSEEALVPVHLSVAEFMAGRHLAEQAAGDGHTGLSAASVCGANVAGRQPPAPGLEGVFAWFANFASERKKLLALDPYGYVATVGGWDLALAEYEALLDAMAKNHKQYLPWNREFWQRLRSNQAGLGGLFQAQLRQPDGASRRKIIVLEVMASISEFPGLMPTVAGLLADHGEDREVRERALNCLVNHASHGLVARALRMIGERQADAGACAWFRSRYASMVLRTKTLETGSMGSRKAIVNFFGGRCATDYFVFCEQAGRHPELAGFALAWMQRRGRLQLAAAQEASDGSSVLAHLTASVLNEKSDSEEMLQLLLTPAGKTIVKQPAFREKLQKLPGLKLELFGKALAVWGTEKLEPDERLAIDLLAIGGYAPGQVVAALENALAGSSGRQNLEAAAGNLFHFLHCTNRKLERGIRIAPQSDALAGLLATFRRGRLLESARYCLQDARSHRRHLKLYFQRPDFVEQVRKNPALVKNFAPEQLSYMHMKMRTDELSELLQPARPIYLERCRALLSSEWPGMTRITDDYARGVEYVGQNPFLDGLSDLFARDRAEFSQLPEHVTGIGIVFATASVQYREELPAWLRHLAGDDKGRLLIGKLVAGLSVKALRHRDGMLAGEWLSRYKALFDGQLHLAVLGKSGKAARPVGLASVLAEAMQIAGSKDELVGMTAAKRNKPGFAGWPSAACWQLAAWFLNGGENNAGCLLALARDAKALEMILKMADMLYRDDSMSAMQKAFLLELALIYFGDRSFSRDGVLVGVDATVASLVFDLLRDLKASVNWQTYDALKHLSEKEHFANFDDNAQFEIRSIMARSLPQKLGRDFSPPDASAVCRVLDSGSPLGMTGLQDSICKEIRALEDRYQRGEGDLWSKFWNMDKRRADSPKMENVCRNYLAEDMRSRLRDWGATIDSEHQLAQERKADLWVAYEQLRMPIELKLAASRDLRGGLAQINAYAQHPDCAGHGIYLVLWFGSCSLPGTGRVDSPRILEERLAGDMSAINPWVVVVVMDLAEPKRGYRGGFKHETQLQKISQRAS